MPCTQVVGVGVLPGPAWRVDPLPLSKELLVILVILQVQKSFHGIEKIPMDLKKILTVSKKFPRSRKNSHGVEKIPMILTNFSQLQKYLTTTL